MQQDTMNSLYVGHVPSRLEYKASCLVVISHYASELFFLTLCKLFKLAVFL